MKTSYSLSLACLLIAAILVPLNSHSDNPSQPASKQLVALALTHQGVERKPVKAVFISLTNCVAVTKVAAFNPAILKRVMDERCDEKLLPELLSYCVSREHWIVSGRYGNTEFKFYRADGRNFAFTLDKTNTTMCLSAQRELLGKESFVWRYLTQINNDFSEVGFGPPEN